MKRRSRQVFPKGSHMSPTGHYTSLSSYTSCCLSYVSFSADGLHRATPLRRPFRRMVSTAHYLLVLFGGWSAQGSQMSPTGGWSAHALLLANGLHRPLQEWCRPCTLQPTLPQARQHTLYAGLSLWNLDIKTFWAHLWPLPSKRGKAAHRHGTRAQQLPLPSPSLKSTYVKIRDATSCSRGAFCGISVVLSPSSNVHEGRISLGGAEGPLVARGGVAPMGGYHSWVGGRRSEEAAEMSSGVRPAA